MAPIAPGNLEGRPPPGEASPLQARIDAAVPGATVEVEPGVYRGDLYVDRTIRLVGRGRPKLVGSGKGSVVRVRAPDVVVEGFDIDGLGGGDLAADSSGVHVAAPGAVVRDCHIANVLFGVYLRPARASRGTSSAASRARSPARRGPASTSGTRWASPSWATTSRTPATASTS